MTIRLKQGAAGGVLGLVLVRAAWIIVPFEGDKRQAYTDIAGVVTACLGHTGADIESGQHYSEAQCQAWFATDETGPGPDRTARKWVAGWLAYPPAWYSGALA
ncbi:glycoside hydrolase family protein [Frateuria aurantia]|uniref:Lysozyme n=1 Tax=Frateuria aurantia (strain ATCC 33424 / DSM 6220 / KCTC 2777 / LMG 1558 / NBRC 3245 / NCIMB 13370) TaxID=767434 RepID=H8L6S9_FRAAD|nr:hypothetical protein Fraau_1598 [Frateuria aurantia DSM 6220]